jgi:hypothetical protein
LKAQRVIIAQKGERFVFLLFVFHTKIFRTPPLTKTPDAIAGLQTISSGSQNIPAGQWNSAPSSDYS